MLVERMSARPNEAELHRLRGELLLARGGHASAGEAEACFKRALELARVGEQRAWELRAATSLARLRQLMRGTRTGAAATAAAKGEEAQRGLAAVYDWFSEGLDTSDLREAAALLFR
jgi:hypothetical protein